MGWHATAENEQPQEIVYLRAAAARTKGDIVRIGGGHSDGVRVDIALADDTNVYKLAVANQDIASGSMGEYVAKGTVQCTVPSGTYTAGNGLLVLNGAVADSGTTAAADTGVSTLNDFAVLNESGTTVTTIRATLYGHAITATT